MSQKPNPCNEEKIRECEKINKVCNPNNGNCVGKSYLKQIAKKTANTKVPPKQPPKVPKVYEKNSVF